MPTQAVFEIAPNGRMIESAPSWLAYTGQAAAQSLGFGWIDAVHPDDRRETARARRAAVYARAELNGACRVRRADGSWCWTNIRAVPVLGGDGRIRKWIGMAIDISAQRDADERYRLAAQATRDVIWDFDFATGTVTWSEALAARFGHVLESGSADKHWWIAQIHPGDRRRVVSEVNAHLAGDDRSRWFNEYRFARADGSYAHVLDRAQVIRDSAGKAVRAIGAMVDLSEKRRAEAKLRMGEERLRLAVAASGLGIADYDCATDTLHWSDELRAILGVGPDEPADRATAHALIHPDDRPEAAAQERRARRGDFSRDHRGVRRIHRADDGALRWVATQSHPIYDESGRLSRVIVTAEDVTDEKAAQDRLQWTATHDAVTGLRNRTAFQAALDVALEDSAGSGSTLALLLIDLDNFKQINDSYGHHAGDLVLRIFGDRITAVLPPGAVFARFGGDEFAIVLPGAPLEAAPVLAGALQTVSRSPIALDGGTVDLRASIGVAIFPDHAATREDLIKCADMALYAAKDAGRAAVRVFDPAMRTALQHQAAMLAQARTVVANAWAQPFYQPKIALESGRVMGLEALFRWRHPRSGMQSPATIANAFDDFELASVLGETMVEAVLADVRRWRDSGVEIGRVAINASAAEFRNPEYGERLIARLAAHGVPGTALELEITETAFLGDSEGRVLHALETLRAAGMTIALDDFGTGFSSLAHLRQFPVDTLKIDQSFIGGIGDRPGDRAIVEVVLRLGEALGLTIVAEGVETESQAAFLRSRGCAVAQGYLFARPLPADAIEHFVAARGTERRAR
ncbi:MAG: EAL domain-containing protein [Sphingomonas sp.]